MPAPLAWPFAIGGGRRRDWTTVCAPGYLIDDADQAVLADRLLPGEPGGPALVEHLVSGRGRLLTTVVVTHRLVDADLPGGSTQEPLRDAHDRPLELIYGFVVPELDVLSVAPEDLAAARSTGMAAYAAFAADEEGHRPLRSDPFTARSGVREKIVVPPPPPPGATSRDRRPAVQYVSGALLVVVLLLLGRQLVGGEQDVDATLTAETALDLDEGAPVPVAGKADCSPADLRLGTSGDLRSCAADGTGDARLAGVTDEADCRPGQDLSWQTRIAAGQLRQGRLICVLMPDDTRRLLTLTKIRPTTISLHATTP